MAVEGLRIVTETLSGSVAGGRTNCARSPSGSVAERMGSASLQGRSERTAAAAPSVRRASNVSSGTSFLSHVPPSRSTNASPGLFTQTSVTPDS